MAIELVAGTSHLSLISLCAQRPEQLRTCIAGELVQVPTQGRGALVIRDISNRRPRGNRAKPLVEGSELTQERLERWLTQPSFLRTRRILKRFQAIQN